MGVSESIRKIREAIDNNKLIIFVGAGVSVNSKLPKWSKLIKEFGKGLNINIDREFSADEYLKIPQYYYNQRGFKEYYDVINRVFDVNADPNLIHEYILKMAPQHIITTNYDDLIEQAIENNLLFYDTVSEDNDLPYTPNGRLFIKMHGDLKKKNIVLKEDDYLSYSENFRLIETFVKALFVNHTVLFIGYSLQDYDLKLILRSINSILGENFQKAYIIDVSGNKDIFYNDYFDNLGVNIIDVKDISSNYRVKEIKEIDSEYGKNIVRILQYILDTHDDYSEVIDFYYNKLKYIRDMLSVRVKDIAKILGILGRYRYENGHLDIYNVEESDTLCGLLKVLLEYGELSSEESKRKYRYIKDKYETITKIFLRANIQGITIKNGFNKETYLEVKFNSVLREPNIEIINNIQYGNFFNLNTIASKNYMSLNVHDNKYFNEIIKAYCNYIVGRYVTAYGILKATSNRTYRDKDYISYFICEYNKEQLVRIIKNVGNPLIGMHIGETVFVEQVKDILDSFNKADLNIKEIYCTLSKKERKNISFLEDLILNETYLLSKVSKTKDLMDKVEKQVTDKFVGANPLEFGIREIKEEVREFWEYTHKNFLMVDHYSEVSAYYKNYVNALFSTYSKEKQKIFDEDDIFAPKKYIRIMPDYEFDIFDVNIICRYVKDKELKEIISKYDIHSIYLNQSNSVNSLMLKGLLNNIIVSYNEIEFKFILNQQINTLLVFLSRVKFGSDDIKDIISNINNLMNSEDIDNSIYKNVATFIHYQVLGDVVLDDFVKGLITKFITKLLNKTKILDNQVDYEIESLNDKYIQVLANSIKDISQCKVNSDDELNELFNEIEFGRYKRYKYFIVENVFIPLRKIIDSSFIDKICSLVEKDYENMPSKLYLQMNISEIVKQDEKIENIIFSRIDNEIEKKTNAKVRQFPDPLESEIMVVGNLYYLNRLLNREKALNYKGHFDIYDLIIDKENFDYRNRFKPEWLNSLPVKFLEDISKINEIRVQIKDIISKKIINEECDTNIKQVFFEYFN
jgi:hypothetical protein